MVNLRRPIPLPAAIKETSYAYQTTLFNRCMPNGIAFTSSSFKAFGGHLLSATVGTGSLEITVIVHDKKLQRKMEEPLGANVLQLQ
ncbi:MAG TPA: hypothetical protein VK541_06875 [Pedobacter sp.]|uniref:hypothetical protein n=1 Tax=Pedobacter sp. TaxID=1411316 RepID=UPI002C3B06D4|nr:hypothetical protein [Pedobacter sp.]HMI02186.1 hypothetical protein [Pedobacter sp.]